MCGSMRDRERKMKTERRESLFTVAHLWFHRRAFSKIEIAYIHIYISGRPEYNLNKTFTVL